MRKLQVWARFPILIGLSRSSLGLGQTKAGPTPSPKGAAEYFIDLKNGATIPEKTDHSFRSPRDGRGTGGLGKGKLRTPPSADRYGPSAA